MQELIGTIFNIQRYSIDDGPGVRSTVFFKGCPLSCLWCSNPESQNPEPEVSWRYTSCKRCGTCIAVCPEGAINFAFTSSYSGEETSVGDASAVASAAASASAASSASAVSAESCEVVAGSGALLGGDIHVDRSLCKRCGKCVEACLQEALSISGKRMSVDDVLKVVKRDYDYYEASGGGVTASGGEILMQADFVAELFHRCKSEGIGTCADTSGFGDPAALAKILADSDIVLYDLKHMDPGEHTRACGHSNEIILNNLELAFKSDAQIIVRVPLIPDFNTSDEALFAIAAAVRDRAHGAEVNIMPYHRYGANKYRMLGKSYPIEDLRGLTQDEKDRAREIFESFGSKCEVST